MYIRQNYKLEPTEEQKKILVQWLGQSRFVWNYMLDLNIKEYQKSNKFVFVYGMNNLLPTLKKQEETSWLKEIPSQCLQQKCQDLDTALKHSFKKTSSKNGFPKFKSRKTDESGIRFPSFVLQEGKIILPKMKSGIKVRFHREFIGEPGSITISRDKTGNFFASVLVKITDIEKVSKIESVVGIDLGLKEFAVTSDSEIIENPRFGNRIERQLKKLNRSHSKKQKGSNNREKARLKLARKHKQITNKRKNFLHQTAASITKNNDLIVVEDLNVKGMMKNHKLAKAISDVSWGSFSSMLEWHSMKRGKHLVKVGRWFASSKLCSNCGNHDSDLTLNDRTYKCDSCGFEIDRDLNAAINIKNEGIRIFNTVGTTEIYACGDMISVTSLAQEASDLSGQR